MWNEQRAATVSGYLVISRCEDRQLQVPVNPELPKSRLLGKFASPDPSIGDLAVAEAEVAQLLRIAVGHGRGIGRPR